MHVKVLTVLCALTLWAVAPGGVRGEDTEPRTMLPPMEGVGAEPAPALAAMEGSAVRSARVRVVAGVASRGAARLSGSRVVLDPETGQPRAATAEELARAFGGVRKGLGASLGRARRVPGDVDLLTIERADGTVMLQLDERFWSHLHAMVGPETGLRIGHGIPASTPASESVGAGERGRGEEEP